LNKTDVQDSIQNSIIFALKWSNALVF
jgi:hypothetical protein